MLLAAKTPPKISEMPHACFRNQRAVSGGTVAFSVGPRAGKLVDSLAVVAEKAGSWPLGAPVAEKPWQEADPSEALFPAPRGLPLRGTPSTSPNPLFTSHFNPSPPSSEASTHALKHLWVSCQPSGEQLQQEEREAPNPLSQGDKSYEMQTQKLCSPSTLSAYGSSVTLGILLGDLKMLSLSCEWPRDLIRRD